MSPAYQQGADCYYQSQLFRSAQGLHRLAEAAFVGEFGLQERFEATFVLRRLEMETGQRARHDEELEYIQNRMLELGEEYIKHWSTHRGRVPKLDPFFTVPIKVYCRLAGAHKEYGLLVAAIKENAKAGAHWPVVSLERSIPAVSDDDRLRADAARALINNMIAWCASTAESGRYWPALQSRLGRQNQRRVSHKDHIDTVFESLWDALYRLG
jgi:hypothetical protein